MLFLLGAFISWRHILRTWWSLRLVWHQLYVMWHTWQGMLLNKLTTWKSTSIDPVFKEGGWCVVWVCLSSTFWIHVTWYQSICIMITFRTHWCMLIYGYNKCVGSIELMNMDHLFSVVVHLIINSVFECIKGESTLSTNWYYNTIKKYVMT